MFAPKCIRLVCFLHIHTKYLDLQACKKLAHGGVEAFHDNMCTNVNVKRCTRYIVNVKIKYATHSVQHTKYKIYTIFTMLCTLECIYWLK